MKVAHSYQIDADVPEGWYWQESEGSELRGPYASEHDANSEALICAAFRAGYEAGYMHAGPKGLVLDEVVPSAIEIAAIRAAVGSAQ